MSDDDLRRALETSHDCETCQEYSHTPTDCDVVRAALAARPEPRAEGHGTTTQCPLDGVHEHVFRGPHGFIEWYDGGASVERVMSRPEPRAEGLRPPPAETAVAADKAAALAATPPAPASLDVELDQLAKSGPPTYVEVAALTIRDWLRAPEQPE